MGIRHTAPWNRNRPSRGLRTTCTAAMSPDLKREDTIRRNWNRSTLRPAWSASRCPGRYRYLPSGLKRLPRPNTFRTFRNHSSTYIQATPSRRPNASQKCRKNRSCTRPPVNLSCWKAEWRRICPQTRTLRRTMFPRRRTPTETPLIFLRISLCFLSDFFEADWDSLKIPKKSKHNAARPTARKTESARGRAE